MTALSSSSATSPTSIGVSASIGPSLYEITEDGRVHVWATSEFFSSMSIFVAVYKRVKTELRDLTQELSEERLCHLEKTSQVSDLQLKIAGLNRNIILISEEKETAERRLKDEKDRNKDQQSMIKDLESQIKSLQARSASAEKREKEKERELSGLTRDRDCLRESLEKLRKESEKRVETCSEECRSSKALVESQRRSAQKDNMIKKLRKELTSLKALKAECVQLRDSLFDKDSEMRRQEEMHRELNDRIKSCASEHSVRIAELELRLKDTEQILKERSEQNIELQESLQSEREYSRDLAADLNAEKIEVTALQAKLLARTDPDELLELRKKVASFSSHFSSTRK